MVKKGEKLNARKEKESKCKRDLEGMRHNSVASSEPWKKEVKV